MLGSLDLEVLGSELHRGTRAAPEDRVADGSANVEIERIAELVGLGGVIAFVASADASNFVLAGFVHVELVEQLVERVLTELANSARREFELSFFVLDQTRLFQAP